VEAAILIATQLLFIHSQTFDRSGNHPIIMLLILM
jgi:hypothetical protein